MNKPLIKNFQNTDRSKTVDEEIPLLCKALWVPRKALRNATNYYYITCNIFLYIQFT